jgi:DNA replication protein DnaC
MAANKDLPFLAGALKAPRISQSWARLADQARESGWSHEEYLAPVLETEVNARNHSGAKLLIKAAGFPAVKTLDEFTLTHRPGISKDHLGKLASGR